MNNKHLLTLTVSTFAIMAYSSLYADNHGFYTGIQLGQSKLDASASSLKVKDIPYLVNGSQELAQGPSKVKVNNDGFAGRGYLGYELSKYFSLEGGYTQYATTKVSNVYGISGQDEALHQGAVDGVVKATMPINQRLSVFAKAGEAYVFGEKVTDATGTVSSTNPNQLQSVTYTKENVDTFRPTYGLGMGFKLTHRVSMDFTWSHIASGADIQDTQLLTLGFAYHFI